MNKKALINSSAALCASALFAGQAPVVSDVVMSQDSASREVTITYKLANAPAVVTLDIETNCVTEAGTTWASIGGKNVWGFMADSDAFRVVEQKDSYTIKWHPDVSWPDHKIPNDGARAVVTAWALDNTPDYMVVDIAASAGEGDRRYYQSVDFLPGGILGNPDYRTNKIVMRRIPAKGVTWTMGSVAESGRNAEREATHTVSFDSNYYMGVFEVTQSQYAQIMGSHWSSFFANEGYRAMRPVENIPYVVVRSLGDAPNEWPGDPNPYSFLGKLRTKSGIDFDLPSEAQWEYACRAGNGEGFWNNGDPYLADILPGRWYSTSGAGTGWTADADASTGTSIVGTYAPNSWGLYDMHGNVIEWCLDWFEADITTYGGQVNINRESPTQTRGGTAGETRVVRGGSFYHFSQDCRSAWRGSSSVGTYDWGTGFRLCCTAGLK